MINIEIILGKTAGFCNGVTNAIQKTEEILKKYKNIYCLGEIVHNSQVINELESKGLKIVEKIEEANNKTIIRAHGIPREVYNKAKELNIEIFDFTCPIVLNIHKLAEEHANQNYYIFLIGIKTHPENIGTISFCGNNSFLIETEEDITKALNYFNESNLKKLLIIGQTTFSLERFNNYVNEIKKQINENIELKVLNTICNATRIRQEETKEISKQVEYMIIIGGKNSSNTKKLYDIAKANCENTVIVETKEELDINLIKEYKKVGIMAGASTPNSSIENIINLLK